MLLVGRKAGHGKDVQWTPRNLLPNALTHSDYDAILPGITLRELTMLRFMNTVTDRPDWMNKVFDDTVIQEWRAEAINMDVPLPVKEEMTETMFEYCIQELRYRAQNHASSPNGAIQVFPGVVYKSDSAISSSIKKALQSAVRPLEDVPEHLKEWRPGSDGNVLELVHPSLYPLVYGRSKILPLGTTATTLDDCLRRCGEGEIIPTLVLPSLKQRSFDEKLWTYSTKFQWLPCEVDISGEKPRILTYVNNLHPRDHKDLYFVIEDILAGTIPLWNLTLAPLREQSTGEPFHFPRRIPYKRVIYDPDLGYDSKGPTRYTFGMYKPDTGYDSEELEDAGPQQEDGESFSDFEKRLGDFIAGPEVTRKVVLPEPPEQFVPLEQPDPFCLKTLLGQRPMQVIVKLVNIELTPDKPEYQGTTWHFHGQMNEAICASATYYYSSENITGSSLSFQQCKESGWPDTDHQRHTTDWKSEVFGMEQTDKLQTLGSIETREGRLIISSNLLLRQEQAFKLADPTKPGHMKILSLFLVDPNTSIISTADVPPQQRDWWAGEVVSECTKGGSENCFGRLPEELRDKIFGKVTDFPLTRQDAEEYRRALEQDRKDIASGRRQRLNSTPWLIARLAIDFARDRSR